MSILIEGMSMPSGLAERGFVIRGDGRVRTFSGAVIDYATAVPVPPHGRLIDADALLNKCEFVCTDDDEDIRAVRYSIIKAAPTIIESEESWTDEKHQI